MLYFTLAIPKGYRVVFLFLKNGRLEIALEPPGLIRVIF